MRIFDNLKDSLIKKKALFICLIILAVVCIVLGVFSAISIGNGIFDIDLSNVAYIRFLRGKIGFAAFVFNCFMTVTLIWLVMILCFAKPYTAVLSIIFYLYFVYSQTVIFVSIIMIYGFFNVLIMILLLLILLLVEFALLLIVAIELSCLCNTQNYFGCCFNINKSRLLIYSLVLLAIIFVFCLVTLLFKSFVVLLVY